MPPAPVARDMPPSKSLFFICPKDPMFPAPGSPAAIPAPESAIAETIFEVVPTDAAWTFAQLGLQMCCDTGLPGLFEFMDVGQNPI